MLKRGMHFSHTFSLIRSPLVDGSHKMQDDYDVVIDNFLLKKFPICIYFLSLFVFAIQNPAEKLIRKRVKFSEKATGEFELNRMTLNRNKVKIAAQLMVCDGPNGTRPQCPP